MLGFVVLSTCFFVGFCFFKKCFCLDFVDVFWFLCCFGGVFEEIFFVSFLFLGDSRGFQEVFFFFFGGGLSFFFGMVLVFCGPGFHRARRNEN